MDSLKIAVVGSRRLQLTTDQLDRYLPLRTTEIVTGGAKGIDTSAMQYAEKRKLKLVLFLPDYDRYGKRAPLVRNEKIVSYADIVFAFWDGMSTGTLHVMGQCRKQGVTFVAYRYDFQLNAFFLDETVNPSPAYSEYAKH